MNKQIASAKLEVANFYFSQGEYEDAYHYATNAQISYVCFVAFLSLYLVQFYILVDSHQTCTFM